MNVTITKVKKSNRFRKDSLKHKPSGFGKGKWHSRASLWKFKMKARRKRIISNNSRRANRT